MKVLWTEEALAEIEAIVDHIAADNPAAARAIADRIFDAVMDQLPESPRSGRPGRVEGTRELVVHHAYIVVYRVTPSAIEILTVRHAARLWPEKF